MSINELRAIVSDYYNINLNILSYFHERNNYSTNLKLYIRALQIDLNLENDMFMIQAMLINRTQQINNELNNFNNIYNDNNANMITIDPDNNWLPLFNSTLNLLRIIHVFMGLIFINHAQININNQVVDDIMNQLGVNNILNNHQNNINNIRDDINNIHDDIENINVDINIINNRITQH